MEKNLVSTGITVVMLFTITVILAAFSFFLIGKTQKAQKVKSFTNAFIVYSQMILLMIQTFVALTFCYMMEYLIKTSTSPMSFETKYTVIIFSIGLVFNVILIVVTFLNLIIIFPAKHRKTIKRHLKSLAEKLPCQLRFILIPTAKKIYLSIKQLATDVCGNLNQFFQALADFFSSLKPDDKDDK